MSFFKSKIGFIVILLISVLFFSCENSNKDKPVRIDVRNNISWAYTSLDGTPEETEKLTFTPLKKLGYKNLEKLVGSDGKFIWVKIDFEISEELKDKDLGLFVSYLHFADKVWINNSFAGEYGRFPPNELSSQYTSHFYPFTKAVLNRDGINTVLIKVYCLGRAEISDNIFIGAYEDAKTVERKKTFSLSTFYMQFEGGMFAAFLIYLIMYLFEKKKHKEYLSFSLSCLFTLQFAVMFFAPGTTLYTDSNINFLLFYKYCMCFCFYAGSHFLCLFMMEYLGIEVPLWRHIVRSVHLALLTLITFIAPTYYQLMQWATFLSILTLGALALNIGIVIYSMFTKKFRYKATVLIIGLLPLLIGAGVDVVIHYILKKSDVLFYMYVGWQGSIIAYLIVLCVRFTRASVENMYLNQTLREEVDSQTSKLKIASKALESELNRAKTDVQMASIVQQKTFEQRIKNYIGWDVGVSYMPLSEVSGDMYDFYSIGFNLTGFSLFDVSGHGVAASLITMLSKNIVYQAFKDNQMENRTSGELLEKINDEISRSKGNAENYLTGLMFQIDAFDDQKCKIQLANAGHPHPLLYSQKEGSVITLMPEDLHNQYGAIGIHGMEVSFQDINFEMETGDILVCYTDGVTEIENPLKQQFGSEQLKNLIEDNHNATAQELIDIIISTITVFAGENPREDDITLMVFKRENPADFIEEL